MSEQVWFSIEGQGGQIIRFAVDRSFLAPSVPEEEAIEEEEEELLDEIEEVLEEAPADSLPWWKAILMFSLLLAGVIHYAA